MGNPQLAHVATSSFRRSFRLQEKEKQYIAERGISVIAEHAERFLRERLQKKPSNDGRQTPWKGHPAFVAQHATATCCRRCMEKWHGIPQEKRMDEREIIFCRELIIAWIEGQLHHDP